MQEQIVPPLPPPCNIMNTNASYRGISNTESNLENEFLIIK